MRPTPSTRLRGAALRAALALALALVASSALAPSIARGETRREYVNRYVLFTDWVSRSEAWVTRHLEDLGLCRAAHAMAEELVENARRMTPPAEFRSIHPHVLLVLENAERMYDCASSGDRDGYRRHRRIVHEEQRLIGELLQAEGHLMPSVTM